MTDEERKNDAAEQENRQNEEKYPLSARLRRRKLPERKSIDLIEARKRRPVAEAVYAAPLRPETAVRDSASEDGMDTLMAPVYAGPVPDDGAEPAPSVCVGEGGRRRPGRRPSMGRVYAGPEPRKEREGEQDSRRECDCGDLPETEDDTEEEMISFVYAAPPRPLEDERCPDVTEAAKSPSFSMPMMCVYAGPEYFSGQKQKGQAPFPADPLPQPAQEPADGLFCPACGCRLERYGKFCPECGAVLPKEPVET